MVSPVFLLCCILLLVSAAATPREYSARSSPLGRPTTSLNAASISVNVLDFGAVGDGVSENTAAFQNALNSLSSGGVALVPSGRYKFNGTLTVPAGVTLQGSYSVIASHPNENPLASDGSFLMPYGGRGSESGDPFISLNGNGAVKGFTIWYPEQVCGQPPQPYPWTFALTGSNPSVTDVECLNCWNFISATNGGRHYIARVQGQPLNIGIFVDSTYDIGRIEDAHFNPWFCSTPAYTAWQLTNGRAFVFGRSDWEYVLNTFAFAYAVGYHFIQTSAGACNGNFLGIGADMMANSSVLVEAIQPMGIQITNGEFTSFLAPSWGNTTADSTQIVLAMENKTFAGPVRLVNAAFWGPSNQVAKVTGLGMLSITDSNLMYWDFVKQSRYAVLMDGSGSLLLRGNVFGIAAPQVYIGSQVDKAIISENFISGPLAIDVASDSSVQIVVKDNIADS